jgi:sulfur relay protein TusB/DsrH
MAVLFLVTNRSAVASCAATAASADMLLLLDDAVRALDAWAPAPGVRVCVRAADCPASGVSSDTVQVIDDAEFVRLVTEHDVVVAWS